jgi:DNA-binding GntR family transcriptional regulator
MFTTAADAIETATRNLTLRAFEHLRVDVIGGVLRPGERLRVQALAKRYGTGATAIREALSRLVTEGLVLFEAQRGFLVSPVSRAELRDLTQTRIDLETLAIARAVERGDAAFEAEIVASLHLLSRRPPPTTPETATAWGKAHRAFHEALVAGCGSPWLMALCRLLYDKSERYRCLANIQAATRPGGRGDDHRELADAVLAKDAASACRILAVHYQRTTEIILQSEETAALFAQGAAPAASALPRLRSARAAPVPIRAD